MQLRLYSMLLLFAFALPSSAQITLKGVVRSAIDKKEIPFATLYAKELEKGTVADMTGHYTLSVSYSKEFHLTVSSLGFQSREILVKPGTTTLNILLEEQSVSLDEFTVTAQYRNKVGSDATIGQ